MCSHIDGNILPEVMNEFQHSDQWKEYQRLLDGVAEAWIAAPEPEMPAPHAAITPAPTLVIRPTVNVEAVKSRGEALLLKAQNRWLPIAGGIPFSWVPKAAGVHHKDAYDWKNGKLPESSSMSVSIERILESENPSRQPPRQ